MSAVDARFDDAERDALLAEVRNYLPAFLSKTGAQRPDPAGDVRELLGLREADLDRVVAVHVCLTDPVRAFHAELRRGLRHPISATNRRLETGQAIRGAIDWSATVAMQTQGGHGRAVFVTRTAERVFDTPENRALAWLLGELDKQLRRADPRRPADRDGPSDGWDAELSSQRAALRDGARHHWLRGIPARRPDRVVLSRMRAARSAFYSRTIPDAIEALDRFTRAPSPEDLTELLCQRFFEPSENWRLFELVVALRIARAFAERSPDPRLRLLGRGADSGPYAVYRIDERTQIKLHYQRWPAGSAASTHASARVRHALGGGDPRPDLVIERTGPTPDASVLELKASREPAYLRDGLTKLLGYLKDRPDHSRREPSGWLVAPRSSAFRAEPSSEECELWVVDADEVAAAAVARFAP